jgi:acyl transferase domain-containing protein/NADP-dependent 3-hydroxy acid dehydrogenase YdfG/acyl carrier protein
MTDFFDLISTLSPKRLALLALEQREQLDQLEEANRRAREPIAIVGMACRFPGGADDPASFWELLQNGRDAIRPVPADRWDIEALFDPDPDAPARMSARNGGFLADVGGFDSAFFGIAPREALTMDPQQRLLLETAWEALEHAGIAADRLAGSASGVFVGICNGDHFNRLLSRGPGSIDAYLASGNAHSVAAGRIAYFLGLQGPALSVDTACSSSLVALHLACRSLRAGDSRVALAAGVNVMCSPETTIALSKAHMLAPDGRCKTFDASADGFSRGEGCGVLVLKRLTDAQADGDHVLAVIRGTAVNQDGHSGGLTVPNGPAQEAVIGLALADAGVAAADIGYVEAHGTGTSLGDPIEVRALAGALGAGRTQQNPLLIGSVKTNLGHLESAAGIAGVMKVVLALQHERIPRHLHFRNPSPHIAWSEYPVRVTSESVPWPRGERRRLAGVSSFGFSGTNAHVVLEEAPAAPAVGVHPVPPVPASGVQPAPLAPAPESALALKLEPASLGRALYCLPVSGRSRVALAALAGSYADTLAKIPASALGQIARTAGAGRSHFSERAAVVATTSLEAVSALRALHAGETHPVLHRGTALPGQPPEVVFLFTGQGSQYPGMSRQLYDGSAVFRDVIDRCDALLGADGHGRTLKSVLWSDGGDQAPIHETAWTQPALFAVEFGLAEVWRSWGVEPAAVIGHSVGEYVAACVAGVFTLEEGLRLIAERGRLMQALPPGGTMAALFAPADEVAVAVAPYADRLAIAAVNAADSVVISGEAGAIDAVLEEFARRDVRGHRLFISLAAHSPLVEPALAAMESSAAGVSMRAPRIPVAWNLTGGQPLPAGDVPDATYWRRHLREPVRFAAGMAKLHADGFRTFLEVGPHPTLMALAQRTLPEEGVSFLNSLRRGKADWSELLQSVARLYTLGATINWANVSDSPPGRQYALPTYPFERRRFWVEPGALAPAHAVVRSSQSKGQNSLGATRLPTATPIFQTTLTPDAPSYLAQHMVRGAVLVAGPVFLELAQACAAELSGHARRVVESFAIRQPLVLPPEGRTIEVHLTPDGESCGFAIHSRGVDGQGPWTLHVTGRLTSGGLSSLPVGTSEATVSLDSLRQSLGAAQDGTAYYAKLQDLGIDLGAAWRTLREAHLAKGLALARVELEEALTQDVPTWAHPTLVDGALQSVGLAMPTSPDSSDVYLLTGIEKVALPYELPRSFWCHAVVRESDNTRPAEWLADVTLLESSGRPLGMLRGVCLRRAAREALQLSVRPVQTQSFYRLTWEEIPTPLRAAAFLAAPQTFESEVRAGFTRLATEHGMAIYEDLLPELDRLSADHVIAALRQLGFEDHPGRVFEVSSEAARLGVRDRHARLFVRMLDMLVEDGLVRRRANGAGVTLEVSRVFPLSDPGARYDALLQRYGNVNGELLTLRRCASELAGVLNGTQDPLQLLFPGGSLTEARQLYVESPYARTYNSSLAAALRAAIAKLPADARLRVLEIGAGTGGTSTYVLPLLPAERVEYTFTDLSPLFLERAAEQFAAYPFVEYRLLDIERDPASQGFERGRYDIVIAANVLHATADLTGAVAHARDLLAPGGLLLLLEGVAPERWVDLTFGMTEGWWRFIDTRLRPAYPLIACETWAELLAGLRFEGVVTVPGTGVPGGSVPGSSVPSRSGSQQALIIARAPLARRPWLLVGDVDGLGAALAKELRARGEPVMQVAAERVETELAPDGEVVYLGALELATRVNVDGDAAATVDADADVNADAADAGVKADAAADADAAAESARRACELPLAWLGKVVRSNTNHRVWLVTRGAQAVDSAVLSGAQRVDSAARSGARWQTPLWGVGRVFALEQPGKWGGLVDLPLEGVSDKLAAAFLSSIDARDSEDQVAWRGGKRFAARLVPAEELGREQTGATTRVTTDAPTGAGLTFRADGTYLITGGFGGLGWLVARWMVQKGARHVALLGRNQVMNPEILGEIETLGGRVIPLTGDVADETVMKGHFERLTTDAPPLRGVVHAAAALSVAPIGELDSTTVREMLRPKIAGTVLLERLTRSLELDFFVLFSSTTALLGASGMAHYAAANAFLDATAIALNTSGRRTLSVNWGTWEAMRLASADSQRSYREGGLNPMAASDALHALEQLLRGNVAQAVVADIDWTVLKALHESRRPRPLLAHLGNEDRDFSGESLGVGRGAYGYGSASGPGGAFGRGGASGTSGSASGPTLLERLAQAPATRRRELLIDFVRAEAAAVLGTGSETEVAPDVGLFEMGMDSLMSVELRRRLERGAARKLPSTLTFNYPNVGALAGFLERELAPSLAQGATATAVAGTQSAAAQSATTAPSTDNLDELSDEELEKRLLARLSETR